MALSTRVPVHSERVLTSTGYRIMCPNPSWGPQLSHMYDDGYVDLLKGLGRWERTSVRRRREVNEADRVGGGTMVSSESNIFYGGTRGQVDAAALRGTRVQ